MSELFFGTGELPELMRKLDWSKTAVGDPAGWPSSLRTVVNLCLSSRYPMTIFWGPEFVEFYNDAYRPVLGASKHPKALGQAGRVTWPEIWETMLGPMFADVMRGVSHSGDDTLFVLDRNGYVEETYFNFSYDPIRDDAGRVAGVFVACQETTERVLAERRLRTVRALAQIASSAKSESEACTLVATALADNADDLPFASLYLRDGAGALRAVASARVEPGALPPFAETVARGEAPTASAPLDASFGAISADPSLPPPNEGIALPIARTGDAMPAGVLVVGRNPRRALDQPYREFLDLLARTIASVLASARAHQEATERADALAELDRAKTIFFGNVSHEFRTPLTLLLGPIEETLRAETIDGESRARLALAHRNAQRLSKLVDTLLDFARIEAGRIQASFQPTELAAYTQELASVFRSAVERAGLRLVVDTPPLREAVHVDREMWERIVLNLLSNALKHTFTGEIAVTVRERGDSVELDVRDTGVGIPADELPKIFERFHRVRQARARTQEGSGIGLALVQELVKLHGGTIHAESVVDRGTTMRVSIPKGASHLPPERIARRDEAKTLEHVADPFVREALQWLAEAPREDAHSAQLPADAARVLLADDNADMREYVARILAERWRVETVADGAAALAAARREPPDLIVADVMMPHLDGFGLIREVRADARLARVPVLLLSARAGDEAASEGLARGADDYLAKPFSARHLVAHVEALVVKSRAREAARAAADRERERLYGVFMQAPGAVVMMSGEDFVVDLANPQWLRIIGRKPEDLGRPLFEILPELRGQGLEELLRGVLRTGESHHGSGTLTRIDRRGTGVLEDVYWDFVYAPLRNAAGEIEGVLSFGFDVTDRVTAKRHNDELRQIAEAASRAKDEFFSALSHELRTPLNAIVGWSTMLRRGVVAPEQTSKALETIERNARLQARLVDDMLDMARIEQGKMVLSVGPVEMVRVVDSAIDAVRPAAEAKGVRLQPVLDSHAAIVGDADRLQQVVWNLLSNAIKFTPRDGRVQIRLRREHSFVELVVADDGQGIPADFLPHIFDRFRQADASITRKSGGLGLGLAIARSIVELHGGTITAQSDGAGRGATFVVKVPTAPLRADSISSAPPPSDVEARPTFECPAAMKGLRLLVVDDEPETRELMRFVLEQCESHVTLAASAPEALALLAAKEHDVLVSDIGMPEKDGYWLIGQVRGSARARIPAIALTAYARSEDRTAALKSGFDMHLTKPIDPNELLVVIATLVEGVRRRGS